MRIEVIYSLWGAEDDAAENGVREFSGGVHDLDAPSDALIRSIAGAEAAGIVVVVEATKAERSVLERHVESQEAGEKAYATAVAEGRWHEGNLQQFILDAEASLADEDLAPEQRAWLLAGISDARTRLGVEG